MLFAVAIAGFPVFVFMWMYTMYKLCTSTGPCNLPSTSGIEPASCISANNKISFVWVNKWTNSAFGYAWGKQGISVKWQLVASWPADGIV